MFCQCLSHMNQGPYVTFCNMVIFHDQVLLAQAQPPSLTTTPCHFNCNCFFHYICNYPPYLHIIDVGLKTSTHAPHFKTNHSIIATYIFPYFLYQYYSLWVMCSSSPTDFPSCIFNFLIF